MSYHLSIFAIITKVIHIFVWSTFQTILFIIKGLKLIFYCPNINISGHFSPKFWNLNSRDAQLRKNYVFCNQILKIIYNNSFVYLWTLIYITNWPKVWFYLHYRKLRRYYSPILKHFNSRSANK